METQQHNGHDKKRLPMVEAMVMQMAQAQGQPAPQPQWVVMLFEFDTKHDDPGHVLRNALRSGWITLTQVFPKMSSINNQPLRDGDGYMMLDRGTTLTINTRFIAHVVLHEKPPRWVSYEGEQETLPPVDEDRVNDKPDED